MGSIAYETAETNCFYPSDWEVHGGAPYEAMMCPDAMPYFEQAFSLRLGMDPNTEKWQIINDAVDKVLIESVNKSEIIKYFMEFMMAAECWLMKEKADQ